MAPTERAEDLSLCAAAAAAFGSAAWMALRSSAAILFELVRKSPRNSRTTSGSLPTNPSRTLISTGFFSAKPMAGAAPGPVSRQTGRRGSWAGEERLIEYQEPEKGEAISVKWRSGAQAARACSSNHPCQPRGNARPHPLERSR